MDQEFQWPLSTCEMLTTMSSSWPPSSRACSVSASLIAAVGKPIVVLAFKEWAVQARTGAVNRLHDSEVAILTPAMRSVVFRWHAIVARRKSRQHRHFALGALLQPIQIAASCSAEE